MLPILIVVDSAAGSCFKIASSEHKLSQALPQACLWDPLVRKTWLVGHAWLFKSATYVCFWLQAYRSLSISKFSIVLSLKSSMQGDIADLAQLRGLRSCLN